MNAHFPGLFAVALGLSLGISPNTSLADTFGSGTNTYTIDFVEIGDAGNAADVTGHGAVSYNYRIGKYEISQDAIDKATAGGMTNVTASGWGPSQPTANITWYEAAAFANWLNTSTGHQSAYNLTWTGSAWSMNVWSSAQAWQLGGENLYRNKDAYYFLPSENEWYKAAYYDPNKAGDAGYYLYATGSDIAPDPTEGGTDPNTAVYGRILGNPPIAPADINDAGGLSPYGTMAQSGNVWEWAESAVTQPNSNPNATRVLRGGCFLDNDYPADELNISSLGGSPTAGNPLAEGRDRGFRIASVAAVPEPSTCVMALAGLACGGYFVKRRRGQA